MSHFVYRLTDADGALLYVGQTCDVDRRLREHQNSSPWARAASLAFEEFPTREEALIREREIIQSERPLNNVQWGPSRARTDLLVVSIRLTPEQHDRLREIAASKHRSMAGELRMVIEAHIEANEPSVAA